MRPHHPSPLPSPNLASDTPQVPPLLPEEDVAPPPVSPRAPSPQPPPRTTKYPLQMPSPRVRKPLQKGQEDRLLQLQKQVGALRRQVADADAVRQQLSRLQHLEQELFDNATLEMQLEMVMGVLLRENLYPLPSAWLPRALDVVDRFEMLDAQCTKAGPEALPAVTLNSWLRWKQLMRQLLRALPALQQAQGQLEQNVEAMREEVRKQA